MLAGRQPPGTRMPCIPDDEEGIDDEDVTCKEVLVVVVDLGDHRIEDALEGHKTHERREQEHVVDADVDDQNQSDHIHTDKAATE